MRTCRSAFTRTETIVVSVVIVLGITFTVIFRLRQDSVSKRVDCFNNLRQIGQGLLLYANENRGQYPRVRKSMLKSAMSPTEETSIQESGTASTSSQRL